VTSRSVRFRRQSVVIAENDVTTLPPAQVRLLVFETVPPFQYASDRTSRS
jgi:hypothetical protein